ncbi:uncharacterized protein LOC116338469 [Contarinia nasturtii]|uniref:uncharacterized protein LOC116338469 n=1 Tax=Contarinia nasturtii TaxID=265458 RepID=UPI0012D4602B|nr:uncharacterized protein LOC116338469 [Contarinia nasturtii]
MSGFNVDTNGIASGIANNKSLPQSPASMGSSESETLSISDEQTSNSISRSVVKSSRKSSKTDSEKERPPWRTVVIAPPQKVNKNALLKAKILDATRRALLAQKINHVGSQTDAYTTLLREKAIGVQKDLIKMIDKCEDTDGTITIRKDRPGGMIITQTVGQMTERVPSNTIATQTPLPRTYLSFASLATKTKSPLDYKRSSPFERQMLENELLLQTQQNALKTVDSKLNEKYPTERETQNENELFKQSEQHSGSSSYEQVTPQDIQQDENSQSLSSSAPDTSTQPNKIDKVAMKMQENMMNNATFACWDDFDFSDNENDLPDLPRRTISEGSIPRDNFNEIVIGQRLASMTLTPLQNRSKACTTKKKKSVTWNDRQLAVTKLINEASALIDIFNEVSIMLGPEMNLSKHPTIEGDRMNIPKSKWDPILSESCNNLEKTLTNYRPREHLSSAQLLALSK